MSEQFKLDLKGGGKRVPKIESVILPEESSPNADLESFSKKQLEDEQARLLEMKVRFASSEPDRISWINERLDAITALLNT
jgi:hypothetical protein